MNLGTHKTTGSGLMHTWRRSCWISAVSMRPSGTSPTPSSTNARSERFRSSRGRCAWTAAVRACMSDHRPRSDSSRLSLTMHSCMWQAESCCRARVRSVMSSRISLNLTASFLLCLDSGIATSSTSFRESTELGRSEKTAWSYREEGKIPTREHLWWIHSAFHRCGPRHPTFP